MKVVLFCGGLGTRIREYSEALPKPMIPIGQEPIMWHVMDTYSRHGHRDFVLCLGYKANTIKDYFLNYRPQAHVDCIVSHAGTKVEYLGQVRDDWRIAMIDTGVWRNIGESNARAQHVELLLQVLRNPDIRNAMLLQGAEAAGGTPEAFGAYIRAEIAKWAKVIKASGTTVD